MPETIEHRVTRSKLTMIEEINIDRQSKTDDANLVPEFKYIPRPPKYIKCQPHSLPSFIINAIPKVQSTSRNY